MGSQMRDHLKWDKLDALEKLARYFALFSDRVHRQEKAENPQTLLISEL
jgi:hypothetical protein